jgi:hypothetical protein
MEREAKLAVWWRAACRGFGLYFLTKSAEDRAAVLQRCCPDMPVHAAGGSGEAGVGQGGGAGEAGVMTRIILLFDMLARVTGIVYSILRASNL